MIAPKKRMPATSFSSTNRLKILPLHNHLTSEHKRSNLWSVALPHTKLHSSVNFNGLPFTKFTIFTSSCSTECNFGSRSRDHEASLWMLLYTKFTWEPIAVIQLGSLLVSCQSRCSFRTVSDAVRPRNTFCFLISPIICLPSHLEILGLLFTIWGGEES